MAKNPVQNQSPKDRVVLAVTGASGSIYAQRVLENLLRCDVRTYLIFTDTARKVISTELPDSLLHLLSESKQLRRFEEGETFLKAGASVGLEAQDLANLRMFDNGDLYAPVASGSEGATHMIVCPSSMGSLARIAHGISGNLIERCADVMMKERRTLVIVPRETPFSLIHLQNMVTLTQAGAHIVPAMPGFYHRPTTIDELVDQVVERVLDAVKIPELSEAKKVRWNLRSL